MSTRKLMNTQQAAEYVGQYYGREPNSPRTIVSWIHSGLLKASREPGARGRFVIDEVDLLMTLGAYSRGSERERVDPVTEAFEKQGIYAESEDRLPLGL